MSEAFEPENAEQDSAGLIVTAGVAGETAGLAASLTLGLRRRYDGAPAFTQAVALIVCASLAFNLMNAVIRHLSAEIHPFEIAFFRNIFGLVALSPFFFRHGFGVLRTQHIGLHMGRALINVVSMMCFFYALSITPLAEVASMGFTLPIFVTIFAAIFLKERLKARRILALAIGLLGALIIVRPGVDAMQTGPLIVLAGTAIWGLALMIIKVMARTDTAVCITAWASIMLAVLSLAPALMFWNPPDLTQYAWLAVIGGLGTTGALAVAQALKLADASALMPYDFVKLVWAAIIGFIVFAEVPSAWTWVGAAVIFLSTLYLTYRESKLRREGEL